MADAINLNNSSPSSFNAPTQPAENALVPAQSNPPVAAGSTAPPATSTGATTPPTLAGGGAQQASQALLGGGTQAGPQTLGDAMGLCCGGVTVINQSGGGGSGGGGFATVTAVKTANYTAAVSELVQVDPSAGDFNVTLPSAAAAGAGKQVGIAFASDGGGFVTMLNTGGDTINGQPSGTFQYTSPPRASVTFVSDGVSNWMILG